MSLLRYPEYKDSGIEWLGEVPAHWEMRKIAHGFSRIGSGTTPPSNEPKWYEGGSIPWVTTSELRENLILETKKSITDEALSEFTSLQVHPPGSLAIAMYGATIGRLGVFGVSATTNQACCVLSGSKSIGSRFAFYWLLAFKDVIVSLYATGGGQPNINQETIASLWLPAPSLADQAKIADFLDHETARIDALVEEQQRLIELLKEKRQAVISHAVTKGLDPDVPMRDSGVEWLGEVPAHWEVKRIRHVGRAIIGLTYAPDDIQDSGTLVLRSGNIQNGSIDLESCVYVEKNIPEQLRLANKDILICSRNGSRDLVGKSALIGEDVVGATFGAFMTVLRSRYNDFLFHVLNSYIFDVQAGTFMTSTVNQLTTSNLYSMQIPFPNKSEQLTIASFLNSYLEKLDSLQNQAKATMYLLQERRSALISAAVTGKIDVRGWQPPSGSTVSTEATQTEAV